METSNLGILKQQMDLGQLTQAEAATALGVKQPAIARYLSGVRNIPDEKVSAIVSYVAGKLEYQANLVKTMSQVAQREAEAFELPAIPMPIVEAPKPLSRYWRNQSYAKALGRHIPVPTRFPSRPCAPCMTIPEGPPLEPLDGWCWMLNMQTKEWALVPEPPFDPELK